MKTLGNAILCAAITADGKLDQPAASPGAWPEWFGLQPGDVLLSADRRADPVKRLRALRAQDGTRRVVFFGGPQVFRRLFDHHLVSEIILLVRPTIDGRRGAATLSGVPDEFFPEAVRCRLLKMEVRGHECLLHYRVLRTPSKRVVVH